MSAEFVCGACGFEWKGERATCPRCRAEYAQPSMFEVERVEVERPASEEEIAQINEATADETTEWVGLPEFVGAEEPFKLVVSCDTEADRDALLRELGIETIHKGTRGTLSVWWPDRPKEDLSSLRFVEEDEDEDFPDPWELEEAA